MLPGDLPGAEPSDLECVTYLAGVAARALGVVTHADLADYHRLNILTSEKAQHTRLITEAALAAGLTPVVIAGDRARSRMPRTGHAGEGRARESAAEVMGWADPAALAEAGSRGRNPRDAAVAVRLAGVGPQGGAGPGELRTSGSEVGVGLRRPVRD